MRYLILYKVELRLAGKVQKISLSRRQDKPLSDLCLAPFRVQSHIADWVLLTAGEIEIFQYLESDKGALLTFIHDTLVEWGLNIL